MGSVQTENDLSGRAYITTNELASLIPINEFISIEFDCMRECC